MIVEDRSAARYLSTTFAELLLGSVFMLGAALTVWTHVAQVSGLSFRIYAVAAVVIMVAACVITFLSARRMQQAVDAHDFKTLLVLLGIGALCGFLAVVSHRSTLDDYLYLPNVIYVLENPDTPMGFKVHFVDGGTACEIVSYHFATANSFEYGQGGLAHVTGIDFLSIYYLLVPALFGLLLPFTFYYALFPFLGSRPTLIAAVAVLIAIGIVLLLGDKHRTFGNLSLTRAFHGKTFLLALGIPFVVGATISYFRRPSFFQWLLLFVTATAMVGASASAIPVLLGLATVLAIAMLVSTPRERFRPGDYVRYFASFGYLLAYAAFIITTSVNDLGPNSPVNRYWPTSFFGHLIFFINPHAPVTPLVVAASSALALYFTSGRQRLFLLAWMVSVGVLFLNPLVAPFVSSNLTSTNIYWRLFYIFPFPLVLGICAVHVLERVAAMSKSRQIAFASATTLLLVVAHIVPVSTSAFQYKVSFRFPPGYKLPLESVQVAEGIVAVTPAGTMLAPTEVAGIVPLLDSRYPQIRIREDARSAEIMQWLTDCGHPERAVIRAGAADFAAGDHDKMDDFQRFLNDEGNLVTSIVLTAEIAKMDEVRTLLTSFRFTEKAAIDDYEVYWREAG